MKRTTFAHVTLVAVLALAIPAMAACSSAGAPALPSAAAASPQPSSSSSPGKKLTASEAKEKYNECMAAHGAKVPDDGAVDGGSLPDQSVIDAAMQQCKPILKGAGVQTSDDPLPPEFVAKLVKQAQCMRAKGYDYPDPDASGKKNNVHSFSADTPQSVIDKMANDDMDCARKAGFDVQGSHQGPK